MKPQPTDRCRQLLEQVSRFLDGDLSAAQRRTVGQHLRRCPCCQHVADGLKHTVDACHKAGGARLPADVRIRAKARIAALLASSPAGAARR